MNREGAAGVEVEHVSVSAVHGIVIAAEPHFESHAREYGATPARHGAQPGVQLRIGTQTVRAGCPDAVAWLTTLPSTSIRQVSDPGAWALSTNE